MMKKKLNKGFFRIDYYVNLKSFAGTIRAFDKQGIPLVKFYVTNKMVYNPTSVALFALSNLQLCNSGNAKALNNFELACRWLISNGIHTKVGLIFPLDFDHPIYGLKAGWISAMTQGLVVSCFVRRYILSGDILFLELAKEAAKPLQEEIRNGGVAYYDDNSNVWLEEVPSESPPHILNGFIYGIMGLYDLYCILGDTRIGKFIIKAISTLEKNIHKYDLGYWSKYQLNPPIPATLNYHNLHIQQLLFLYKISQQTTFKRYAIKFALYTKCRSNYLFAKYIGYMQYVSALVKTMRLKGIHYIFSRAIRRIHSVVVSNSAHV